MTCFKMDCLFNDLQTVHKISRTNVFMLLLTLCCLVMSGCGDDEEIVIVDPEPEITFPKEVTG